MNVDTNKLPSRYADCLLYLLRRGDCEGAPWPERNNLHYFTVDHCISQVKTYGRMDDPTVESLLSKLEQQRKETNE